MGMDWRGIFRIGKEFLVENEPSALFVTGVLCMGTCVALTAKVAPKIKENVELISLDREEGNLDDNLEYAKTMGHYVLVPCLPAAVAGIASILSFGMSNRQLSKKAAGAIAAYTVAEKALGSYQDKVIEELGEEVHDRIFKAVVDEVPEEVLESTATYVNDDTAANVFPHEINDKLYYDHVTGRIFWSSDEKIKDAESTVNKLLIDVGVATLNDFYSALLLDCDSVVGDALGWRVDDPHARSMDVIFGSRLDRIDNTPLITIGYRTCAVNLRELERR